MTGRTILLVLFGLGLGLVLGLLLFGRRAQLREDPPDVEVARTEAPAADVDATSPVGYLSAVRETMPAAPAPAEEDGVPSAREFLADWYGAQWPEFQARIEADAPTLDLDMPYHFTPWEAAEPELAKLAMYNDEERKGFVKNSLDWPDELTADWVHNEFALPREHVLADADLYEIENLVAPIQEELTAAATRYAELLDFYIRQRWESGNFRRAPFTTYGMTREEGFFSKAVAGLGWATGITLTREDYPDMAALEQDLSDARERRSERVVGYLRGRFAH